MKRLFYNGKFYLERGKFAEAVLCEEDKILCIGSTEELQKMDYDQFLDLKGKTVLPGLNDSHCHLSCCGAAYVQVDLTQCHSIEEIITICKEFIEEHPELCQQGIRTMGWNQDLFTQGEKRIPTKEDVDQISTEIPIALERICGHICSVNSKLMEIASIDASTPAPAGGTIEKDEQGEPTGVFTENAVQWIESLIPDYSPEVKEAFITKALHYAEQVGLTSVQSNDVGGPNTYGEFPIIRKIYEEGKAKLRFRHQTCFDSPEDMDEYLEDEALREIYKHNRLTLGPVKMFKDGSLGGYTALMRSGYVGDPKNHGVDCIAPPLQHQFVQEAAKRGLQVVTHVIGDRAIEETIDAYESSFTEEGNVLRHGLVHCQITDMGIMERIAKLNIPIFYQPIFLDYDLHIAEDRVGKELASTSYAFKTAEDLKIHVGYGTDAPVEDLNPFPCIYAAVTRCDKSGFPENGFFPKEKVDVETAIDAYTIGSAYCEFQENVKGRIKEGYLADFTVLDRDIFTIDPQEIKDIKAAMTIIGGEAAYFAE